MKKNSKKSYDAPVKNSIISHIVSLGFDFVKHFLKDFEQSKAIKKADKINEQFATMEHLIIKLESKMNENRKEIEDLKTKVLWGNIIVIGLLVAILIQIIV